MLIELQPHLLMRQYLLLLTFHVRHILRHILLLLRSETDDSSIKIADFGFAKIVRSPQSLKTQCGTPVSCCFYVLLV